jgi:threonine/homoserine/homoserine lactone efflux protein
MMPFQTWALFCATETVLCFTPGPAVLLVVSLALTRGARAGLAGSLGILVANAVYFILSATGIGAVLLASWQLFSLINWLGAAYLSWRPETGEGYSPSPVSRLPSPLSRRVRSFP